MEKDTKPTLYDRFNDKIWYQLSRGDKPRKVIYHLICAGWDREIAGIIVHQGYIKETIK